MAKRPDIKEKWRNKAELVIGKTFNSVTIINICPNKFNKTYVQYLCKCGNIRETSLRQIIIGRTKSCGCYSKNNFVEKSTIHGWSNTNLYKRWKNIKIRCYNKNSAHFKNYGGRGIIMCEDWKNNFSSFRDWAISNGYKHSLQIDRINNDGNYEPSNCRWVTNKINANNKRDTKFLTYNGETKTLLQWSYVTNIKYFTLYHRIRKGWSVEKAFKPVK